MPKIVRFIILDDECSAIEGFACAFEEPKSKDPSAKITVSERLALKSSKKGRENLTKWFGNDVRFELIPIHHTGQTRDELVKILHDNASQNGPDVTTIFISDRNLLGLYGENVMTALFNTHSDLVKKTSTIVHSSDHSNGEEISRWSKIGNILGFAPKPLGHHMGIYAADTTPDWVTMIKLAMDDPFGNEAETRRVYIKHGINPEEAAEAVTKHTATSREYDHLYHLQTLGSQGRERSASGSFMFKSVRDALTSLDEETDEAESMIGSTPRGVESDSTTTTDSPDERLLTTVFRK